MLYTNLGKRLFWGNAPLYILDTLRTRPMMVIGSTGYGKTEELLSIAFADALKGRPVIFVDGKCDENTRDKLFFWCHKVAKRPFLTLMPFQEADYLTNAWNPLMSTTLGIGTVAESFINAYADPSGAQKGGDGEYYLETQRSIFTLLMRTLHSSGFAYSCEDIRYLLEYDETLDALAKSIPQKGVQFYSDLLRRKRDEGRNFRKVMQRFTNHIKLFSHWSLNSYNPTIQFDRIIHTDSVVYVGLPVNSEPYLMSAIGNIILNQLKAISAFMQTSEKSNRRAVSCIIDEAGSFVDTGLAEWICKVRSSGFLLALGIQNLANLERRRVGFGDEIRSNTPNVMIFNPQDAKTAVWFSSMCGHEPKRSVSVGVSKSAEVDGETGAGTVRADEKLKIHPDALLHLRIGQFVFRPPLAVEREPLLAAAYLPDPPERPDCKHRRLIPQKETEMKGINLSQQIQTARRNLHPV